MHSIAIKDMAGLLTPQAAELLVGAIRKELPDMPIHIHSHDTAGASVATMVAAAKAGADIVDVAIDSMSGLTSQPSMGAVAAALKGTELETSLDLQQLSGLNAYWDSVRGMHLEAGSTPQHTIFRNNSSTGPQTGPIGLIRKIG